MREFSKYLLNMAIACVLCLVGPQGLAQASEVTVKAKLDAVATTLVKHAAQNVLPRANNKAVTQENGAYAARYVTVNEGSVTTEMIPGQGKDYVGIIKYTEQHFVCRGASKAEALAAACSRERTRNMTEIIAYTKGKWLYH